MRSRVVGCLSSLIDLVGADRGAVVWVDDYGAPLVHTHCLIDLTSGTPRRDFEIESLRETWAQGVPGLLDRPDLGRSSGSSRERRSSATVALGSDGTRSWFLVVDSLTPRGRLSALDLTDAFMYRAGRIASLVLHRSAEADVSGIESGRAGWSVLQDMESASQPGALGGRIGTRYVVARLVRNALEDDFAFGAGRLAQEVEEVEQQFHTVPADDPERASWERIVTAIRAADPHEVAGAVLELAHQVMGQGHVEGARHLFESAYLVGVAAALPEPAIDGARYQAVVARQSGSWEEVSHWYGVARDLAQAYGDRERLAYVLDGEGVAWRLRDDLGRAVEHHRRVIDLGRELGSHRVEAFGHHSLTADLRALGRVHEALVHGWKAIELHSRPRERFRALVTLAGLLREMGEFESARHAYSLVAGHTDDVPQKLLALDALAYLEALRGNAEGFREGLRRVDGTDWRSADINTVASLTYYRGRGFALLGDEPEAEEWLGRAIEYAEAVGTAGIASAARTTLEELRAGSLTPEVDAGPPPEGRIADLTEIRVGLERLSETAAIWSA